MLLDDIVAATKMAAAARTRRVPLDELIQIGEMQPPALDFVAALSGDGVKIIAEVKKASPSKGVIKADFDPVSIARAYAGGGAAAISVLTEEKYFQGSLDHVKAIADDLDEVELSKPNVRGELVEPHRHPSTGSGRTLLGSKARRLPLLRKDFIIDPYQVYEARAFRADAVLLIVAILSPSELASLSELTHSLGMSALVEAHCEQEVNEAISSGAKIIGINNRDLKTFKVDLRTTERLRPLVPNDRLVVSESSISTKEDIDYLKQLGVNAALVGEALMTAPDIVRKLGELTA